MSIETREIIKSHLIEAITQGRLKNRMDCIVWMSGYDPDMRIDDAYNIVMDLMDEIKVLKW